jgi:HTH-type transcriptional regulator, sugar sensing transcriptional regulator
MIVQESFLKKIKDFGLNSYEAKIWTALLSRGVSTAGELSDIAGVPRSRSYDILESLEKKGFIVMKIGKPIKYMAIPPEEVVERVKRRMLTQAEEHSKTLEQLKGSDVLNELNLLHSQGIDMVNPTDITGILKGRNQIYNHLSSMIKGAKKSVVLVTTEDGLIRKHKHFGNLLKKTAERGVNIKIMAPLSNKSKDIVQELKKFVDIKTTGQSGARFCIIDNKELAFMLMDDTKTHPNYDSAVWVNTPTFAEALGKAIIQCDI